MVLPELKVYNVEVVSSDDVAQKRKYTVGSVALPELKAYTTAANTTTTTTSTSTRGGVAAASTIAAAVHPGGRPNKKVWYPPTSATPLMTQKDLKFDAFVFELEATVDIIDRPVDEPDFFSSSSTHDGGNVVDTMHSAATLTPLKVSHKVSILFYLEFVDGSEQDVSQKKFLQSWHTKAMATVARYLTECIIPFDPLRRQGNNVPQPLELILTPNKIIGTVLGKSDKKSFVNTVGRLDDATDSCDYDLYLVKPQVLPTNATAADVLSTSSQRKKLPPPPEDDVFEVVAATRKTRKGSFILTSDLGTTNFTVDAVAAAGTGDAPSLSNRQGTLAEISSQNKNNLLAELQAAQPKVNDTCESMLSLAVLRTTAKAPRAQQKSNVAVPPVTSSWGPSSRVTAATVAAAAATPTQPLHNRLLAANVAPLLHLALLTCLGLPLRCQTSNVNNNNNPLPSTTPHLNFEMRLHAPTCVLQPRASNVPPPNQLFNITDHTNHNNGSESSLTYQHAGRLHTKRLELFRERPPYFGDRVKEMVYTDADTPHIASYNSLAYDIQQEWYWDHGSPLDYNSSLFSKTASPSCISNSRSSPLQDRIRQRLLSYYSEFKLMRGLSRIHPHLNTYVDLFVECPCVEVTVLLNEAALRAMGSNNEKKAKFLNSKRWVVVPIQDASGNTTMGNPMGSSFASTISAISGFDAATVATSAPTTTSTKAALFTVYLEFKARRAVRSCTDVANVADIVTECAELLSAGTNAVCRVRDGSAESQPKFTTRIAVSDAETLATLEEESRKGTNTVIHNTITTQIIRPMRRLIEKRKSSYVPATAKECLAAIKKNAAVDPNDRLIDVSSKGLWAGLVLVEGVPITTTAFENGDEHHTRPNPAVRWGGGEAAPASLRPAFFNHLKEALSFLQFHHVLFGDMKRDNCIQSKHRSASFELTDFGSAVLLLPTTLSLLDSTGTFLSADNDESIATPSSSSSQIMWAHRYCDYFLRSLVLRGSPSHRHPSLLHFAKLSQHGGGEAREESQHYRAHIGECWKHLLTTSKGSPEDTLESTFMRVAGGLYLRSTAEILPANLITDAEINELICSIATTIVDTQNTAPDRKAESVASSTHSSHHHNTAINAITNLCSALCQLPQKVDRWALGVAVLDDCFPDSSDDAFSCSATKADMRDQIERVRQTSTSFNFMDQVPPTPLTSANPTFAMGTAATLPPMTPTTMSSYSPTGIDNVVFAVVLGGVDENNKRVNPLVPTPPRLGGLHAWQSNASLCSMQDQPESPIPADERCRRLTVLGSILPYLEVAESGGSVGSASCICYGSPIGKKWSEKRGSCTHQESVVNHLDEVEVYCFTPCYSYKIGTL